VYQEKLKALACNNMTKYIHYDFTHNQQSPAEIVEIITSMLSPRSVVDVGCGTGNFLFQFKKSGVKKVLGIDGSWVNKDVLMKNLLPEEFYEADLENPIYINERFDIALCTEVAEHIGAEYADNLVEGLIRLSDIIIFSAAIPYQGGQNHVNEQWMEYWIDKFEKLGYDAHDLLRPIFWNNKKIQWWYRQNMLIVCNKTITLELNKFVVKNNNTVNNYVHPEPYIMKSERLDKIVNGRMGFGFYFKLLGKKIRQVISPR